MSNKDKNHIVDTNKKISSVEWLFETLLKRGFKYKVDETITQAKAMHKEEIKIIIKTYHNSMFYLPLTNGELDGICENIINKLYEQD